MATDLQLTANLTPPERTHGRRERSGDHRDGTVADRGPLLDELFSRAEEFDFRDAIVTESDGVAIAGREPLPDVEDANDTRAAREAR